jgi:glycosyltransferase involved in cell wall biosynthesis
VTLLVAPGPLVRDGGGRAAVWVHGILHQAGCRVRLALPGDGPFEPRVRFFTATAGFAEDIHFTDGELSADDALAAGDVALVLPTADVGVAAAARALSAGLPVVAAARPELAECVPREQAGLLCPPGDVRSAAAAALRLIEDPALAERLARGALAVGKRAHDPGACRRRLDELYDAARAVPA